VGEPHCRQALPVRLRHGHRLCLEARCDCAVVHARRESLVQEPENTGCVWCALIGRSSTGAGRTNKKPPPVSRRGLSFQDPGSDLLWHACKAHYHRRRAFSLPSSEWDRVVPARYGRQEYCLRFEEPVLPPAPRASNSVRFVSDACRVRKMLIHVALACGHSEAPLHHPLAVRPLEVIWSSLTGN